MRRLFTIEVLNNGVWEIRGVSTSSLITEQSWRNISKGRRARMNEYTYDELDFLWTYARDCVTLEKNDETGTLS